MGDGEDDAGGRAYRHQGADDGDDDGGALVALRRSASDLKVADLEAVNLAAAGRADVRMPLGVAARAEDGGAGTGGIPLAIVASASTGALPISCVSSPCDSRRAASEATVRGP